MILNEAMIEAGTFYGLFSQHQPIHIFLTVWLICTEYQSSSASPISQMMKSVEGERKRLNDLAELGQSDKGSASDHDAVLHALLPAASKALVWEGSSSLADTRACVGGGVRLASKLRHLLCASTLCMQGFSSKHFVCFCK